MQRGVIYERISNYMIACKINDACEYMSELSLEYNLGSAQFINLIQYLETVTKNHK